MKTTGRTSAWLLAAALLVVGCRGEAEGEVEDDTAAVSALVTSSTEHVAAAPISAAVDWTDAQRAILASLSPLPARAPADPTNRWSTSDAAAELGDRLMRDPRLSVTGQRSCVDCHRPAHDWTDGKRRPEPVLGDDSFDIIDRNTPTLWGVGLQRWFFWDGGSDTLWGAAIRHLESGAIMGATRLGLVQRVGRDDELRRLYEDAFGDWTLALDELPSEGRPGARPRHNPQRQAWDSLTEQQRFDVDATTAKIGKAFDAALRRLIAPPSAFDTFVAELDETGSSNALSAAAVRGLNLFIAPDGCVRCHSGPAFSDGAFYDTDLRTLEGGTPDWGRLRGVRQLLDDTFVGRGIHGDASPFHPRNTEVAALPSVPDPNWAKLFRTPTLRRIAHTAPYQRDGRFELLEEVIEHYMVTARALGLRGLSEGERGDLLAFLEVL